MSYQAKKVTYAMQITLGIEPFQCLNSVNILHFKSTYCKETLKTRVGRELGSRLNSSQLQHNKVTK